MRFQTKEEFIARVMAGDRFIRKDNPENIYHYDNSHIEPFRVGSYAMSAAWDNIVSRVFELVKPEPIIETRWRMAKDESTTTSVTVNYVNQVAIDTTYLVGGWYKLDSIEVEVKND